MGLFGMKRDDKRGKSSQADGANVSDAPVKVLGTGCARCRALDTAVRSVLEELGSSAEVEHITDFPSIAAYGVMSMPALVVNGRVVMCGRVPERDELKKFLAELCG